MPTIAQGANLVGSVKLELRSAEKIQAVCILIKGEIVDSGPTGELEPEGALNRFLESKHTVWTAAENSGKSKLQGDYEFPFNIEIPTTFSKNGKTYKAPHTFMEKVSPLSVRYTAELRIVRGKLRADGKVTCTFGYFSMQQPGLPSELRRVRVFHPSFPVSLLHLLLPFCQLAYQENSPLLGPDADPEGWTSQQLSVKGKIFASRSVDVKCTFSLANPLSYTRSMSIPCAMTIETADPQALDLLSSPTASIVCLERSIKNTQKDSWHTISEACAQAVFWTSMEGAADTPNRRQLMGEIHLRANLQPTSAVPKFAVKYAVVVFPFQAAGFKSPDNPLFRQIVEITTRHPPGPRQKTYTPPTYETNSAIAHYYRVNVQVSTEGFT
ncbi:hypothetical protein B0H19DRAFT_1375620 [Mycena capillaripes]|nr:hypothetical protein B0H19DRAFT_1375620 [Mycena capillaripes]